MGGKTLKGRICVSPPQEIQSAVWLFGCLVVWLFGCLVVWLFGRLVVVRVRSNLIQFIRKPNQTTYLHTQTVKRERIERVQKRVRPGASDEAQ